MAATLRLAKVGRYAFWCALAAALLTALAWYLGSRYEWVEQKFRTGMTGEARRNPLHAAELLFRQLGVSAQKIEGMGELFDLPTDATVILWTAQAFDQDQANRLAQWVERGGRVIFDADSHRLNKRFGVRVVGTYTARRQEDALTQLMIDGRALVVEMRGAWLLDAERPLARSVDISGGKLYWFRQRPGLDDDDDNADEQNDDMDDEDSTDMAAHDIGRHGDSGKVMVHFAFGHGYVTVLSDVAMFNNDKIANHDHAEYLVRLARLAGDPGTVYLVPDPHYPDLISWLMQHAWPALAAAAALLGAFLWRAMPRFGPRETPPPTGRPGLLEHLRAIAEFHLKGQHYAALLAPLREDCLRALQQHAAREGAAPEAVALGQRFTGLPADEIERALHAAPEHRGDFLHHASTLARLRDALTRARQYFLGSHS